MGDGGSVIETGVDKLVALINGRERISTGDAAKELGVSTTVIMEWAEFLEEEGIISVEYKLTKTFLVARKIAKKEVHKKAKEYSGKKDVFVRKAEVSLGFLEKEADKLSGIKEEFDKIKKDLGFDISNVKDELEQLEKYESLKIDLDKQIEQQKATSMSKIQDMSTQIARERKKYSEILVQVKKEEDDLKKDQSSVKTLRDTEKHIEERLDVLRKTIDQIESRVKKEEDNVSVHEKNIDRLSKLAETIKESVEKELKAIEPLIELSMQQEKRIKELQAKVIDKLSEKEKKVKGVQAASKRIKDLFKEKMGVISLIEKINQDRNDLKNELTGLIKKAKSFQISAKSADVADEIEDLQKKFDQVDKKKGVFEGELKKLGAFFKSK